MRLPISITCALASLSVMATDAHATGMCHVNGSCVPAADKASCEALGGVFYANGYCPETVPRASEQRFNRFQYIGSHNAFQRRFDAFSDWYTLAEQVDTFGMFNLELDVWWECTDGDCYFEVQHNCGDSENDDPLWMFLDDLNDSHTLPQGFVVVDLDLHIGDPSDYPASGCFDNMPADHYTRLRNLIKVYFSEDMVYTPLEFEQVDNLAFPSVQELMRRGRHIAFVSNRGGGTEFIFDAAEEKQGQGNYEIELRTGDETATFQLQDRFVSLWFPGGGFGPDSDWFTAVNNGFTFPTAYAVDDPDRLLHEELHPPIPTFVDVNPLGEQWGTWWRPYAIATGLLAAWQRMKTDEVNHGVSNTPFVIQTGTYDLNAAWPLSEPVRLSDAHITFTTRNETVILK